MPDGTSTLINSTLSHYLTRLTDLSLGGNTIAAALVTMILVCGACCDEVTNSPGRERGWCDCSVLLLGLDKPYCIAKRSTNCGRPQDMSRPFLTCVNAAVDG